MSHPKASHVVDARYMEPPEPFVQTMEMLDTLKPGEKMLLLLYREPHPLYKVSGHDLYLELPVAPWEAVLGGEVEVPTLAGRVKVSVRPGSRSGQKLRLAGKGLPKPREGHGDLYCVLQIVTPSVLSEREKQLYEELGSISGFNPRGHLG